MATTAPGMDGKEVIGVCREMVSYLKGKNRELKEYALAHPFAGDAKEILYFKYYKPALTGRLLYYYRVYQIESGCPACLRVAEPYYRKAMERAERMMERYLPFYQYYHSGATYRDSYYFLRAKGELSPESGSFVLDEEAEFSTGYDILAARLISVEMLLVHLSRRMERAVLLYDTEQSEQQLHKNTGRLLRRAGRERMPEYLHVYCLTGMSRSERLTAIVQSMDRYHYLHGGIHLVVIDGVADLIRCANDEAESVALIDEIYRLAGIYRTCIAAVVHFVPNGLKLRGHLGSELQRKSAAILSIEKDENPEVSVVKALKVRDGSPLDIPLMQFRWDKQAGMPVYVGEKPRAEKEKRKEKELAEMAREAFARQKKYGYIELCELIQEMLEVKERTAKGYIRYMREKEIIEKEGDCYVHGQGRV